MGKTYTALAVVAHTLLSEAKSKVLLVTPPGLMHKWEQEIRSFNENYLHAGTSKQMLRPRVINDHWDMATLLHNYSDHDTQRVSEKVHACVMRIFCQWHDARNRRRAGRYSLSNLDSANEVTETDPVFMQFCSIYSLRSLEAFFDKRQALDLHSIKNIAESATQKKACKELNTLFRNFCHQQSKYVPNILILRTNSLRRMRSNDKHSHLLNAWLGMRLLVRLWENSREVGIEHLLQWQDCYCPQDMVRGRKQHMEWLLALADINFLGLRDFPLPENESEAARTVLLEGKSKGLEDCFNKLRQAILNAKMQRAGFQLAVVDEAHNWKDGKNGGGAFQQNYAPYVPRKLMLTATPFQIHEGELLRVFKYAAACESNAQTAASVALLNEITRKGIFESCLKTQRSFEAAWKDLPLSCSPLLQAAFSAAKDSESISDVVNSLPDLPDAPPEMAIFAKSVHDYHTQNSELRRHLGRIVIRHSKSRWRRQVHAGRDYSANMDPSSVPRHHGLYEVPGYGSEDDALISFLAMRADQLLRREKADETANAHLRGGLSSSFAAFLESHDKKHESVQNNISEFTKNYMDFLRVAVKNVTHPKVRATVDRALHNFSRVKKTLIFCERLATQQNLLEEFNKRAEEKFFPGNGYERARKWREDILRSPLIADLYLSRSLLLLETKNLNTSTRNQICQDAQAHAGRLRLQGQRRLARLLDLHFLRAAESENPVAVALVNLLAPEHENVLRLYLDNDEQGPVQETSAANWEKMAKAVLLGQNLWHTGKSPHEMHSCLWQLLETELQGAAGGIAALIRVLPQLPRGLRRILLRLDVLKKLPRREREKRAPAGLVATSWLKRLFARGDSTAWDRTVQFVKTLQNTEGSLLDTPQNRSRRQSLWRGVALEGRTDNLIAATLNGQTSQERRTTLCAAFNSPIFPDVLICTAIGSEGIDLHLCCAEIVHHDLPWNPARLEQRNGRIDRVGNLAENPSEPEVNVMNLGIPFLAHDYEDFQYKTVHRRAQKMEVLLGVSSGCEYVEEEILLNMGEPVVREVEDAAPSTGGEQYVCLPDLLVEYLRINFGVVDHAEDVCDCI